MQTTKQMLLETIPCVVMQFTGYCDDGQNETAVVKVDPYTMNDQCQSLTILNVEYEVSGGVLRIQRDADDPLTFLDLATVGSFDYSSFNGAVDPMGPSFTGKILFTTIGFDTGSSYSVKITMKKKFAV